MADQNQVVAATVKVDTANASANIKSFNQDVKAAKASLGDMQGTANVAAKNIEGAGGSFKNLREQVASLPGPLSNAAEGAGKVNTALKTLAANPIILILTAIVAVLTLLYKAFTNTFEGAEKVEQIFAGLKAAAQALFDNLGHLASALVKFFTFDFSGAVDEIKQVAGAVADAYTQMAKLTAEAQKLHQEQLKNDLEAAERQKQLAILREQATDESVPVAERKKALLELQKLAQDNAKEDIDLAKRTAANKIAQLTLEKDGALKNQDEINQIKIEQIRVETENANELRRIGKQITAANKQELAEREADAKAAAEKAKEARQNLIEFENKLRALQQANDLALIKDGYEKELTALNQKIENEKRINQKAFDDKKINKDQLAQLNNALDIQYNLQSDAITDKHNDEVKKKEDDFQKELGKIRTAIALDQVQDTRKAELAQLEITYNEKLQQAIDRYTGDGEKLKQIRLALEDQFHAEQQKLLAKFQQDDDKKRLELETKRQDKIIADRKANTDDRLAAVDAEQKLYQTALDNKVISEIDYNGKVAALADARKRIREDEQEHAQKVASGIANAFDTLAEIAGKQTALGKALAIASTTIKTFQGAIAAFTGIVSEIPGPVGVALGIVAAAGAVAAGIAAVQKIVAVQIPGQGSGGAGATPSGLPQQAAPIAPVQQSTRIDQQSINDFGNAAKGGASRAYVLDADVKNNADRDARLTRAARLGG